MVCPDTAPCQRQSLADLARYPPQTPRRRQRPKPPSTESRGFHRESSTSTPGRRYRLSPHCTLSRAHEMIRKHPPIAEPAVASYTIPCDHNRWCDGPTSPLTNPTPHERQSIIAGIRPNHSWLKHLPCNPLRQSSHPHRFQVTTSPTWGLHGYREERSSTYRSRGTERAHACCKHIPLRQVTLSNPGGEL
jgi:hypothetical protein